MDWPDEDNEYDSYAGPAPTETWGRSASGQHDSGRNVVVAKSLKKRLKYSSVVHEQMTMETNDHEDHSFNGIMFDIEIPDQLPIDIVRVDSVWVRGDLGPMTVYITKAERGFSGIHDQPDQWDKIYDNEHPPSRDELTELKLDKPIILRPNQKRGLYVHSAEDSDTGIVYDNSRFGMVCDRNARLDICPNGMAHLNPEPFNNMAPWGFNGWRQNREFVGRVSFGVRWILWNPSSHKKFLPKFRAVVTTLMAGANRSSSVLYWLPPEMIFFILNQLNWDAFGDEPEILEPTAEEESMQHRLRQMLSMRGFDADDIGIDLNRLVDAHGPGADAENIIASLRSFLFERLFLFGGGAAAEVEYAHSEGDDDSNDDDDEEWEDVASEEDQNDQSS